MPKTADSVLKDLKENKYSPVYFLSGDEPYYIDVISNFIEENALTDAEKGFNQNVVYGKDVSLNSVLESARQFPAMAMRRVLIVKEAQEIGELSKDAGRKRLLSYCQKAVPSTVLVFAYKNKKLTKTSKFVKELDKTAIFVDSKKLYDNKIPDWVSKYCKTKGISIQPNAMMMLSEYIGNNLSRLSNEIDKLLLNIGEDKKSIDEKIISKYIGISKEYNVFELQKSLGQKNIFKSNQIIHYFASNPKNNPVIPIISSLYQYFSKLMRVKMSKDKSQFHLAKILKVNPFFVKDYLNAERNYRLSKLVNIIYYLHKADLQSKGIDSRLTEKQILKELIFKILH